MLGFFARNKNYTKQNTFTITKTKDVNYIIRKSNIQQSTSIFV